MALVETLRRLRQPNGAACTEGNIATALDRARLFWADAPSKRAPLVLDAGLVVVAQGKKTGYFGGQNFTYDANNYLVVSAPIPFECATEASPDEPLLGLFVHIDLPELRGLVEASVNQGITAPERTSPGIAAAPMSAPMRAAVEALADCLTSTADSAILGPALVRQVVYRALQGAHGPALWALTHHDTHYNRIAGVLATIRRDMTQSFAVAELAKEAGMSVSSFHRVFRQTTGSSPLQYIKAVRLDHARSLINHEGLLVKEAASRVGYESASQFSREYTRFFRQPPSQHGG